MIQHRRVTWVMLILLVIQGCTPDPAIPTTSSTPVVVLIQKSLGGAHIDDGKAVAVLPDGSMLLGGKTASSDGNISTNHGGTSDGWLVRLDAGGSIVWQKTIGGTGQDEINGLATTSDGGMLAVGTTNSNDGDVTGNHGQQDLWIIRLNGSGDIQWQKLYGGTGFEVATSVVTLTDGSFVIAGYSSSNDGDLTSNQGATDFWIMKIDSAGVILWQKTYGGSRAEIANALALTLDGGFVVVGSTFSNDGDVGGNPRTLTDYWIIRLDASGNRTWSRTMGGTAEDAAESVVTSSDGTITIAGYSYSSDGDLSTNKLGGSNFWIVKVDGTGTVIWQKTYGGSLSDGANAIINSADGGFLVVGYTNSSDGDLKGIHGGLDGWLIDIEGSTGSLIWQQPLGGSLGDSLQGMAITPDYGLAVIGASYSNDGDVSGNHGEEDLWFLKLH